MMKICTKEIRKYLLYTPNQKMEHLHHIHYCTKSLILQNCCRTRIYSQLVASSDFYKRGKKSNIWRLGIPFLIYIVVSSTGTWDLSQTLGRNRSLLKFNEVLAEFHKPASIQSQCVCQYR